MRERGEMKGREGRKREENKAEEGRGSRSKKKKKKLRWSSAGSITAAGGDDLLKATRSQPLCQRATLVIFVTLFFSPSLFISRTPSFSSCFSRIIVVPSLFFFSLFFPFHLFYFFPFSSFLPSHFRETLNANFPRTFLRSRRN